MSFGRSYLLYCDVIAFMTRKNFVLHLRGFYIAYAMETSVVTYLENLETGIKFIRDSMTGLAPEKSTSFLILSPRMLT